MRVWTIQAPEVLAALRAGTCWRADARACRRPWRPAYRWMADRMREQLGAPSDPQQMPVWLWCQWRGIARPKPDLRARGHLPAGAAGVRIELEIDSARILQSDFELWHYVLNGWFLPANLAEERAFDAHPDRRRISPSWQRIFELAVTHRRYSGPRAGRSIQGVTWELRPGDVRGAVAFTAR